MMPHQLIITSDDYGMCDSVNEGIDACLAAGAMRATCVMTTMPARDAAATLRRRFPHVSVGLHWTLTQGRPALDPARVPSLVDGAGNFLDFPALRRRLLRRAVRPEELRAELRAQHERFVALAGRPDFWNTHQNIHVTPGLFQLCVGLGRELGIPAMRSSRRVTVPAAGSALAYSLRHPAYSLKGLLIDRWSAATERGGTLMPAGAVHLPGFPGGKADIELAAATARWPRAGRPVEVIVHPATRVEPELFGTLTTTRLAEYRVFSDPGLRDRLLQLGFETVAFEVLGNDHTAPTTSAQPTRAV